MCGHCRGAVPERLVSVSWPRRARSSAIPFCARKIRGILTGVTEYYDDLTVDGLLHVAFVRSTVAHANHRRHRHGRRRDDARRRGRLHRGGPRASPTIHGFMMLPPTMNRPPLATDKVRFVGDIVAMVIAESKAEAVDAAESSDRRLRPAARDRRHGGRARRDRDAHPRGVMVRTSRTRWAPVRSKACSTTPTSW